MASQNIANRAYSIHNGTGIPEQFLYPNQKKTIKMEIIMEKGERERMVFVCVYIDNDTDSRTRPKLIWKLNFNAYSINTFAFE